MNSGNPEEQHRMLMQVLQSIPEIDIKTIPVKRRRGVDSIHARFDYIKMRLLYLDALWLGLRPVDPFDQMDWRGQTLERTMIERRGDLAWAQLRVINAGFDLIRDKAIAEGHDFPFSSPRELFAQIMREQRDFELQPVLSDDLEAGLTRSQMQWIGTQQSKLFRGRLEGTEEEKQFLERCRAELWHGFWLYAIWAERFRDRNLRDAWKRYMDCHKNLAQFMKDSKAKGSLMWRQGQPVNSRTGRSVDWGKPILPPDVTESLHGLDFFHSQGRHGI